MLARFKSSESQSVAGSSLGMAPDLTGQAHSRL